MIFYYIIARLGVIIIISVFACTGFAQETEEWKLQKNRDGILIYSKFSPESKYKSIRAVTEFQCTLPDIIKLMKDVEHHDQWVSHCEEATFLEAFGDTTIILYEYYDVPWPVTDRDIIIQYDIKYDPSGGSAFIRQEGKPGYLPVKENMIRVPEYLGTWHLVQQPDGNVHGEYTALVEPGGYIPAWIVNIFSGNGPYDTIVNLKRMIADLEK